MIAIVIIIINIIIIILQFYFFVVISFSFVPIFLRQPMAFVEFLQEIARLFIDFRFLVW